MMYGYHYVPRSPAQTAIFTVEGAGSIAVQPDTVRIVVGAITEGKDLTDIQQQNASIMNAILAGLRQLGIPESNIQTNDYRIEPQYDYSTSSGILKGYRVTHTLLITIQNVDQTGMIIDNAVKNGANYIGNITFTLSSPSAVYNQALAVAVKDAYTKAQTLARASGFSNDPVIVEITEQTELPIRPMVLAATKEYTPTPIQAGQITITAKIIVKFTINQ